MKIQTILLLMPVLVAVLPVSALAQTGGPYALEWSTIDGGGGTSSGWSYVLTGTIGQPDAAYSAGVGYEVFGGFLPYLPTCWSSYECGGQRYGDANCDGAVNFIDLGLMKVAFFSSKGDANYYCCADLNHDESVNFLDLGTMKQYFFSTGYSPARSVQTCPP
jgi:hypothetical protein